jgi:hypothetical protein
MQQMNEPTRQARAATPSAARRTVRESSPTRWLQRLGVAGFAFFLFKGLLWLTLAALAYLARR